MAGKHWDVELHRSRHLYFRKKIKSLIYVFLFHLFFIPAFGVEISWKGSSMHVADGYVAVDILVNGSTSIFLLDTGADTTVVSPELAQRLKLIVVGSHTANGAGDSKFEVKLVEIEKLRLGDKEDRLQPVGVVDMTLIKTPFAKLDGVLGCDFLRKFKFTLDYVKNKFVYEDDNSLVAIKKSGITIPIKVVEGNKPFVTVRLNNGPEMPFAYKVDTGAGKTFIRLQDAKTLGLTLKETISKGAGGEFKSHSTGIDVISIAAKVAVKNMKVSVEDSPIGFLGGDFLSQFIVTIDLQNEQMIMRSTH